ncbi:hypothetical protein P7K49_030599, partial [Saguinus oedipus]
GAKLVADAVEGPSQKQRNLLKIIFPQDAMPSQGLSALSQLLGAARDKAQTQE